MSRTPRFRPTGAIFAISAALGAVTLAGCGAGQITQTNTQVPAVVGANAGVGSIVSAGEQGKPIVVLARRAAYGEHTSDHQVETTLWLKDKPGVQVAEQETDLPGRIAAAAEAAAAGERMAATADSAFIERIRRFIALA